jgi:hypothetical protein
MFEGGRWAGGGRTDGKVMSSPRKRTLAVTSAVRARVIKAPISWKMRRVMKPGGNGAR